MTNYLRFTNTLTSLSMAASNSETQHSLLRGVLQNRIVLSLSLSKFMFDDVSTGLVARIFRENGVLLAFSIASTHEMLIPRHNTDYSWIAALAANNTLEELTRPMSVWPSATWENFFGVLSTKAQLKKVHIQKDLSSFGLLSSLWGALTECGVEGRVFWGNYLVNDNVHLIKCRAFSYIYLLSGVNDSLRLEALRQLPQCAHLAFVAIDMPREDLTLSSALADYLKSALHLRRLQVSVVSTPDIEESLPNEWWTVITHSFSMGTSIRELVVSADGLRNEDLVGLVDSVSRSQSISTFDFVDEIDEESNAFVTRLSTRLAGNYTLRRVRVYERLYAEATRSWFTVSETTRRNSSILARAAHFTNDRQLDGQIAAALERVSKHTALIEDLAEMCRMTKDSTAASIRACLKSFEPLDAFMRLAGVVRERVVCYPRQDGLLQLDQPNMDCWILLRTESWRPDNRWRAIYFTGMRIITSIVEGKGAAKKTNKSARTLSTLFPRIPKTATTLLEEFLRRESRVSLYVNPLLTFARDELCLHAEDCLLKLRKQVITYQDVRNMVENLLGLHKMCLKREPETAKRLAQSLRKLIIIVGEVASSLEKLSEVPVTDWVAVGEELVRKHDKVSVLPQPPFWAFIPKMRDLETLKILGSGGFGVVHLASFKPASLVTTVKLVNMERFTRQKQAAMDKILASVLSSPFIVKYFCCFVCKAYVTLMEYVPGVDLMRLVNHERYLEIDAVKVIMGQLVLALEHVHLNGFLHRDVKVSNMLLVPGGRLKLIDFDTTKVCHGLFSRRIMRSFFRKTPFEFNDAESAGTVPYMAPEVLRRRPYGRSVDWWAAGIVMYKLMTGRVPFRGKTKQALRERIITSPLRRPRPEEREHSATTPAKDMTFRLLRKNAVDRLGSRSYAEIRTHPFFDRFNWKRLHHEHHLCDIPSLVPLTKSMRSRDVIDTATSSDKRRLLKLGDLKDVSADCQRPLLCYASESFKKLMLAVERAKEPIAVSDSFMETTEETELEMSYAPLPSPPPINADLLSSISPSGPEDGASSPVSVLVGADKIDIVLYRKKRYSKYWSFGFALRRLKGEDNINYFVVCDVKPESPAEKSQLLVLDFLLKVNGETVLDLPMGQVKTLIASSGDQMVLTVMSASPYRALTTRRDMMAVLRSAPRESVVLYPVRAICAIQKSYGVELLEPDVWDDRGKQFVKVYVIKTAKVNPENQPSLYPGDVISTVDGTPVELMTREQLHRVLNGARSQLPVTVVPLSPLRSTHRVHISKLRETTISDTNLITRLTAAEYDNDESD